MDQKMEKNKNKTGLVLEGGGMRGIYTAGVLDVFLDEGLTFDGVIGVSAGAVHGCSFLSGQKGRSIRYYKKYCADKRFMSTENLIRTGNFVDTDFCYHELPEILDVYDYDTFNKNKEHTDFYAVCSDVEKGKPVYAKLHDMKRDIDYIRASASFHMCQSLWSLTAENCSTADVRTVSRWKHSGDWDISAMLWFSREIQSTGKSRKMPGWRILCTINTRSSQRHLRTGLSSTT